MAIKQGQIAGSNFNIEVEGFSAGYLSSFQVPSYEAEEATSSLGPDYVTKKMVAVPKIGDASATFNISQSSRLLDWVASLWKKECAVVNTTVNLANHDYVIQRSVEMSDCLITAVSFPDLKAADGKKTLDVTATWKPADIHFMNGSGKLKADEGQKAKAWLVSNFDVHPVFGLDTKWVTSLTLPKISAKVVNENYGFKRLSVPMYSSIEFSSVKLEIGNAGARQARDLAVKVIRDGNVDEAAFDSIIVDMLDPTMKRVLGTFTMIDCILKKFEWAPKLEGGKEQPVITTLEFLIEDFRFEINHK